MSFSNSRWQLCVVRIWPIFLRNKRCFKGSKNPHENKPSHISWWLGCSSAFANLHPQLLCGLQKHTHTISKSCQVLKSGSLHKRRQQECGEQKSMWINHCWLRFVLEHIPRCSSTQARHHCPIHYFVQKCFNDHFLMAFMFIYVHLKFQYSTTENRKIHDFVAPTFLRFFWCQKKLIIKSSIFVSWGGFQLQSTVSAPAVTTWLRWHGTTPSV